MTTTEDLREAAQSIDTVDSELNNFYRMAELYGFDPDALFQVSAERSLRAYGTLLAKEKREILEAIKRGEEVKVDVPEQHADIFQALRTIWIDGVLTGRKARSS